MFDVNDYIMYGTTGVCKVAGIKKDRSFGDVDAEYYVLNPVYDKRSTIMTRVNNKKVQMRQIKTKQEIQKLIKKMDTFECPWIEDDRIRSQKYKEALYTGECEEWIKIIRGIHFKREERNELGKKLRQSDENIAKSAERLLYQEFSVSLEIPIEDVESYIFDHVEII